MKKILLFIFVLGLYLPAFSKYAAFQCSNLDTYLAYLKSLDTARSLRNHPKCNASAINSAYKNKKKWIEDIEPAYQKYFGHPSALFLDCRGCISQAPFYKIPTKEERNSKKYVLILSVDGGGVKGLIPARLLQHIEKQTGYKISSVFDLFVGTSTGGLISLFLNTPTETGEALYDASQLVEMYRDLSAKIFSHSSSLRKIRGIKGVLTAKYSAKAYEQLLKKYVHNTTVKQSVNPLLITSVDIKNKKPFIFSTVAIARGLQQNSFMWQAARATSAAPTYFKPYNLKTVKGSMALVDGGVGINNPSLLGITLAKELYPNAKILLVSLSPKVSEYKTRFKGSGPFGGGSLSLTKDGANLGTLVDNLLDIPSQSAEETAKKILESEGSIYIRIKPEPIVTKIELDDGSKKALNQLESIADDMILNDKQLKRLLAILPSYINLKKKEKNHRSVGAKISERVLFFDGKKNPQTLPSLGTFDKLS